MQTLLKEEEKRPLSYEMLGTLLPRWCLVTKYDSLANFKTLKDALQGKEMMVVLYNLHDAKSKRLINAPGHFIVINARSKGQSVEYFSSTGWTPGKELAKTHSDPDIFNRLLGKNFVYNSVQFQRDLDINTCWRHCLMRCILGHLTLKEYQRLFKQHVTLSSADDVVTIATLLITLQHDLESK